MFAVIHICMMKILEHVLKKAFVGLKICGGGEKSQNVLCRFLECVYTNGCVLRDFYG